MRCLSAIRGGLELHFGQAAKVPKLGKDVLIVGGGMDLVALQKETPLFYTRLLPILPSEFPKFLTLSFMMFWIIFIFTICRDTKDALIVTNCGAEAIAFLKVYGVVPAATLFMLAYSQLANIFSPRALFYITVAPFLVFYVVFAFVLYPMRNVLHPLSIKVPEGGFSFAVNLLRYWTFSLYYIVSELWGSAGIPLLFWSCANDVIKIEQVRIINNNSILIVVVYISILNISSIIITFVFNCVAYVPIRN